MFSLSWPLQTGRQPTKNDVHLTTVRLAGLPRRYEGDVENSLLPMCGETKERSYNIFYIIDEVDVITHDS